MSLKSDIVIVNEYTIKRSNGKGSRGSTPSNYVVQYMARDLATEVVTPIRKDSVDDFVMRYMVRSTATDAAIKATTEPAATKQPPASLTIPGEERLEVGVDRDSSLRPGLGRRPTLRERRAERSRKRQLKRQKKMAYQVSKKTIDPSKVSDIRDNFRAEQGKGGLSFGYGEISLSHEALTKASADIQRLYEKKHTVLKTVISFEHAYLREMGIVDAGLGDDIKAGDYRGHIDQLKLRRAITHGLERMARSEGYDDLRWVGVIQVDTEHVHCHLAMVDAGKGVLVADGTQRGKVNRRAKNFLRRGIHSVLDEQKTVAYMSSQVGVERQNVVSWIRRWTYESMKQEATPQFIASLLPDNTALWRAGSNAKSMRRANKLTRELVEERLSRPGSPMDAAMARIKAYAVERTQREGLSRAEHDRLVRNGRKRIIDTCINSVYKEIRDIPKKDIIDTPDMMDLMGSEYGELMSRVDSNNKKDGSDSSAKSVETTSKRTMSSLSQEEFAARLQSYTSRMNHHRTQRKLYQEKLLEWEKFNQATPDTSGASVVMRDFYATELDYHERCVSKYSHFLRFSAGARDWQKDWNRVDGYGKQILGLESLLDDESLRQCEDRDVAEQLGRERYGVSGGYELSAPGVSSEAGVRLIRERVARMRLNYQEMVDDLRDTWSEYGAEIVVAHEDESGAYRGSPQSIVLENNRSAGLGSRVDNPSIYTPGARIAVSFEPKHAFDDVKGVDMHDMSYEWFEDKPVSKHWRNKFSNIVGQRKLAWERAYAWMLEVGYGDQIEDELGDAQRDFERMEVTLSDIRRDGVLTSQLGRALREQRERQRVARYEAERAVNENADQLSSDVVADLESDSEGDTRRGVTFSPTVGHIVALRAAIDNTASNIDVAVEPDVEPTVSSDRWTAAASPDVGASFGPALAYSQRRAPKDTTGRFEPVL